MIRNGRLRTRFNGPIRWLYIMRFAFLAILTRLFGMVDDPERANVRTVFNCFVFLELLLFDFLVNIFGVPKLNVIRTQSRRAQLA